MIFATGFVVCAVSLIFGPRTMDRPYNDVFVWGTIIGALMMFVSLFVAAITFAVRHLP